MFNRISYKPFEYRYSVYMYMYENKDLFQNDPAKLLQDSNRPM